MRLGILGGSFDPVHYGHLLLAESCREALSLDAVWFLPAAVPPHKQHLALAPPADRAEMLELAIGGQTTFAVCRHEIERGGVNYTVDTLEQLRAEAPTREFYLLMGADSLADLPSWREPRRICELATPVAVVRSDRSGGPSDPQVDWGPLARVVPPERLAQIRQHAVPMPRIDLSSSELRSRVAAGLSIRYRTPRAVEKYIQTHGLYRGGSATG